MVEEPRFTGVGDNENELYERSGKRKVPRWVTIVVIVLAVIGLLLIAMMLLGGPGGHGPARHMGMAVPRLIG
jgi:flagellar basal body-associated protein FliL